MRAIRQRREWLAHVLDRYGRDGHRAEPDLTWSRREFMGAAAAATMATVPGLAVAGNAVDGAAQGPWIEVSDGVLRLHAGQHLWEIDPRRFGRRARARWERRGADLHLALERAEFSGTDLTADFAARLWNPGNGWRIDFRWRGAQSLADLGGREFPLLDAWMAGEAGAEFRVQDTFRAGACRVETVKAAAALRWTAALDPVLSGRLRVSLGSESALCDGLGLAPRPQASALLREWLGEEVGATTRLTALAAMPEQAGFEVGRTTADQRVRWLPSACGLKLECFIQASRRDAWVLAGGGGQLSLQGPGCLPGGSALLLDKFLIHGLSSQWDSRFQAIYTLCRRPFAFETDTAVLLFMGRDEPQYQTVRRGRRTDWAMDVVLSRAHVPVRGASRATLDFPHVDLRLLVGPGRTAADTGEAAEAGIAKLFANLPGAPAPASASPGLSEAQRLRGRQPRQRPCAATLTLDRRARLELPLDAATLSLQRSVDHFDLKFEFRNYSLAVERGRSTLARRWAYAAGCAADPNPPLLIAIFPPQHLMEEVFKPPAAKGAPKMPGQVRSIEELLSPNDLARTLIAAPTRIALQSPLGRGAPSDTMELTVESITDWKELSLAVHQRALPRVSTLDQQIAAMGLTRRTGRTEARHILFAELTRPPSLEVTALEPVTGLVISPDASARFDTSTRVPARGERAPLWRARLRLTDGGAARVIHARGANMSFLSPGCAGERPFSRFVGPLSTRDRAELAILMSGFALPSLRRLHREQDEAGRPLYFDDPKGMVVRPASPPGFLSGAKLKYSVPAPGGPIDTEVPQEGLLVPRPFDEFDLVLTAFRSVLRARWDGEPPAPLPADMDPFFAQALSLEGYLHRAAYGRDALVQVAYKGFLFPFGHRATLLKVSERQIRGARGNEQESDPTAYLMQRLFIVCRRPKKDFPALGQPFLGREFPAARVEMLTTVTPDLIDPDTAGDAEKIPLSTSVKSGTRNDGCGGSIAGTVGRAFWPRTKPGEVPAGEKQALGNEVLFEYRLEDSDAPVRSPLVFVDNTAVHHAPTMEALVDYYEALPYDSMAGATDAATAPAGAGVSSWERARRRLRVASHAGVTRRYAPATKAGQTSFDSAAWILGASGGVGVGVAAPKVPGQPQEVGEQASFAMDALMEGADQPPFYPRVERAFIKMQSLDRLLGRPQGLLEVGFSERYVRHGMDAAGNPSEIYLDVLRPAIDLDLTGQGESAGGVAKPNARLAAISRVSGFVGGRPRSNQVIAAAAAAAGAAASAAPAATLNGRPAARAIPAGVPALALTYDTTSAQSGRFDAGEFLGGALSDAVLLGIIPLRDVVQAVAMAFAPQLEEVAEYGGQAIADALKAFCPRLAQAIGAVIESGNQAMRQALALPGVPAVADPLGQFYPALALRLRQMQTLCGEIAQRPDNELKARAPELAGRLVTSGRELVAALEAVAANPMPEGVAQVLQTLEKVRDGLKDLASAEGIKAYVIGRLAEPLRQALRAALDDLASKADAFTVFDALFGVVCASDAGAAADLDCMEQRLRIIDELVHHPEDAARRLQRTLLHEVLSGPLITAWAPVSAFAARAGQVFAWSRVALREAILQWVSQGDAYVAALVPVLAAADAVLAQVDGVVKDVKASDLAAAGSAEAAGKLIAARMKETALRAAMSQIRGALQPSVLAVQDEIEVVEGQIDAQTKIILDAVQAQGSKDAAEAERNSLIGALGLIQRRKALLDRLHTSAIADIEAIRHLAEMELTRQLQAWEAQLRSTADDAVEQLASRLFSCLSGAFQVGDRWLQLVRMGAAARQIAGWCAANGAASKVLNGAIDVVLAPAPGMLDWLRKARDAALAVTVPATLPAPDRAALDAALTAVRRTISDALTVAEALEGQLTRCKSNLDDPCAKMRRLTQDLTAALAGRLRALETLRDVGDAQLNLAIEVLRAGVPANWQVAGMSAMSKAPGAAAAAPGDCASIAGLLKEVQTLLAFNVGAFVQQVQTPMADIDKVLRPGPGEPQPLQDLARHMQAGMTAVTGLLATLANQIGAGCAAGEQGLRALRRSYDEAFSAVLVYARDHERVLVATLTEALVAGSAQFAKLSAALQQRALSLLDPPMLILQRYKDLVASAGPLAPLRQLLDRTKPDPGGRVSFITALAGPGLASLGLALDQLDADVALLSDIEKARTAAPPDLLALTRAMEKLQAAWSARGPGLVGALRIVERLARSLFAGQLGAFFDFSAIRAELEAQLLSLLPTKVSQRYVWKTALDDFPSGDPIFQIDRAQSSRQSQDLELEARVALDLVKNERTATVRGSLRPFKIRLLGNRLDLVTVKFKGATFEAGTGQSPRYDAPIADVEIGTMLEFIKAFQQYFSPGEGNGPYVALRLAPPEIEAGYRYSTPLITVGNLAVLNVSISVAMLLPFDNRQAYFRFAFGARDNPFIIAAMPYAGGGFVGLLASAKGIIGFEICFEFGALVALKFGPMHGSGRVMAGIYLRSEPGLQVLEGYVTAVGEGSIACFGISVNVCVRVRQEQGGAMVGSSTYSFAFKVGFATLRYSFSAQYQIQGGSGAGAHLRTGEVAALGGDGCKPCQVIGTRVPRKHVNWGRYRKHVAI